MSDGVQTFFDGLGGRFRPEAAVGLEAVCNFDITGEGGGLWHAIVAAGACVVAPGPHASPDVTIRAGADDWLALVAGTLNPQVAFMTGRLVLDGDMGLALRMQPMFLA